MTCQEFTNIVAEKGPANPPTNSEVGAMYNHWKDCQNCQKSLHAKSVEERRAMTDEQEAAVAGLAAIKYLEYVTSDDPELKN